jgi:hypothetical protein
LRNHRAALCAASLAVAIVMGALIGPAGLMRAVEQQTASGVVTDGDLLATPIADPTPVPTPDPAPAPPSVTGEASNYPTTAGYDGQPVVALPGALGGRYTGGVQGYVTVCADRCARLAVVDWCECFWGTADQRVIDLSHAAWPLVTNQPLSRGVIGVRVILDDPHLAAVWQANA